MGVSTRWTTKRESGLFRAAKGLEGTGGQRIVGRAGDFPAERRAKKRMTGVPVPWHLRPGAGGEGLFFLHYVAKTSRNVEHRTEKWKGVVR